MRVTKDGGQLFHERSMNPTFDLLKTENTRIQGCRTIKVHLHDQDYNHPILCWRFTKALGKSAMGLRP